MLAVVLSRLGTEALVLVLARKNQDQALELAQQE
jgi:GGDEF domain-containing protein